MKPKIAIAGASGKFGRAIAHLTSKFYDFIFLEHTASNSSIKRTIIDGFDCTEEDNVKKNIETLASSGIRTLINCSGDTRVDEAEKDRGDRESQMYKVNVLGPGNLARSCRQYGIKFIHLSTEYVFDGRKPIGESYTEEEQPNTNLKEAPTWYGITKALGEEKVLEEYRRGAVIIRFSQMQSQRFGIFAKTLKRIQEKKEFFRVSDQMISPITGNTAARALSCIENAMYTTGFHGIIHVSATNCYSSYQTCLLLAARYGLGKEAQQNMVSLTLEELVRRGEQAVLRPRNSILSIAKFRKKFDTHILKSVEDEIQDFYLQYPRTFVS